jgi:hypothetical protein
MDLLFGREGFPATNDRSQAAQRTVHGLRVWKDFRDVWVQDNDVTSSRVTLRMFAAHTFAKIIFRKHLAVFVMYLLHNSVVLVCSQIAR